MKLLLQIAKISFFLCIFLFGLAFGQTKNRILCGTLTVGYSSIKNYEVSPEERLKGNLIKADIVIEYKNLLVETDYQYIFFNEGNSHFLHNSLGYKLYSGKFVPNTYVLASHIYSNKFPMESLIYNLNHQGFGFGAMFRMKLAILNGDASFAVTYFPSEEIYYKNMQVGWEIKTIGLSVGGIGIRIPDGRFYSGFVFSLRYRW